MLRKVAFESIVWRRERESLCIVIFHCFPLFIRWPKRIGLCSYALPRYLWTLIIVIDRSMTEQKIFGLFSAKLFHSVFARFDFEIIKPNSVCYYFLVLWRLKFFERSITLVGKGLKGEERREVRWRDRHGARQLVFYISSADLISGVLVHHGHRNRVTMQPGYQILRILDKSGPTRMCFYFWHSGWSRLSVPRTLFFPYFYFFFLHDLLVATSPATRFSCLFHYG